MNNDAVRCLKYHIDAVSLTIGIMVLTLTKCNTRVIPNQIALYTKILFSIKLLLHITIIFNNSWEQGNSFLLIFLLRYIFRCSGKIIKILYLKELSLPSIVWAWP